MVKSSEMWLFDKIKKLFKKLFSKQIGISGENKFNLISHVKLDNGAVKFGMNFKVDMGFKLVFTRYNKVFDILPEGSYSLTEQNIPKLYMNYLKSSKEQVSDTKGIPADVYFLNMAEIKMQNFKTVDKIPALSDLKDIWINLQGDFSFSVENVETFMSYFCEEFSIIKNKKLLKEISYIFSYELSKFLHKHRVLFSEYVENKEKTSYFILQNMLSMSSYGIRLCSVNICDVIVGKKDSKLKRIIEDQKQNSENVINEAQARINAGESVEVEGKPVLVNVENNASNAKPTKTVYTEPSSTVITSANANLVDATENKSNAMPQDSTAFQSVPKEEEKSQPAPNILLEENDNPKPKASEKVVQPSPSNMSQSENNPQNDEGSKENPSVIFLGGDAGRKGTTDESNTTSDGEDSGDSNEGNDESGLGNTSDTTSEGTNTNLGQEINNSQENNSRADQIKKVIVSGDKPKLKKCPCCGAENFADAEICCVCKSKLD